jgi:hypothetical protein
MPPRDFVGEIVVSLILLDGSAEGSSRLHAGVGGIWTGRREANREGIHGLEVAIAQKAENVAVEVVRAGAGDDVHHPAGSAPVLGGVAIGDDLEFLDGLL